MSSPIDLPVRGGAIFYLADQGETVTLRHLGLTAAGHAFLAERESQPTPKAYQIDLHLLNVEWAAGRLFAPGRQPPYASLQR